ncbi:MAG: S-DNA-T family DNA segregation ATPase FtsK/SpoIIIE, partial [Oceanospirillaceae bacterium]
REINEQLEKEAKPVPTIGNVNSAHELKETVEGNSSNLSGKDNPESENSGLLGVSATNTSALDVNHQQEKGVFNRLTGGLFMAKDTPVTAASKIVKVDVQKDNSSNDRLDSSVKVLSPTLSELKYRELSNQKNILNQASSIQGGTNTIEDVGTPFKSGNKDASKAFEDTLKDDVVLVESESETLPASFNSATQNTPLKDDTSNVMQPTSNITIPVTAKIESDELKAEFDVLKPKLKIVPLSETHKSTLEDEGVFGQVNAPVQLFPVAQVPDVNLLDPPELQTETGYSSQQLEDMSRLLEVKLKDFGVIVEVVEVNPGPVITRFEIQPAPGVKSSKIANLAKDLARSLAVMSVRVVEVIPGKSVMGIEIPNINRKMVRLSEVLTAPVYQEANSRLTLALGNDIAGNPVVANLAKMPHLLVAGTTGSGKSVGVNAMILSLLFKAGPQDVRLMLIDPKMLELSIYEGIPHLLTPVITDMKEAAGGLRWCVAEMERRYKLMSKMGVRNLDGFNDKVREGIKVGVPLLDPIWDPQEHGESPGTPAPQLETLPYIVVVIDEFADMMMIVGKKVEELIARIAQKARAAGIHLILATQRPSVDVITGLIKANVPTRIAFQVSSKIDSRTILDQGGSENLLGNGDMLFLPAGTSVPSRVHGAFVSDDEVHRTVEAWKKQGKPEFIDIQLTDENSNGTNGSLFEDDEQDALYDEAVGFITTTRKASISSVQRKFKIGYNRAARIVESMEAAGVISGAGTNGQREVIAPPPPPRN